MCIRVVAMLFLSRTDQPLPTQCQCMCSSSLFLCHINLSLTFYFYPHPRILREREREREREGGTNMKHELVASYTHPEQGSACSLFGVWNYVATNWATRLFIYTKQIIYSGIFHKVLKIFWRLFEWVIMTNVTSLPPPFLLVPFNILNSWLLHICLRLWKQIYSNSLPNFRESLCS